MAPEFLSFRVKACSKGQMQFLLIGAIIQRKNENDIWDDSLRIYVSYSGTGGVEICIGREPVSSEASSSANFQFKLNATHEFMKSVFLGYRWLCNRKRMKNNELGKDDGREAGRG